MIFSVSYMSSRPTCFKSEVEELQWCDRLARSAYESEVEAGRPRGTGTDLF